MMARISKVPTHRFGIPFWRNHSIAILMAKVTPLPGHSCALPDVGTIPLITAVSFLSGFPPSPYGGSTMLDGSPNDSLQQVPQ
jgi:hypothetical protein